MLIYGVAARVAEGGTDPGSPTQGRGRGARLVVDGRSRVSPLSSQRPTMNLGSDLRSKGSLTSWRRPRKAGLGFAVPEAVGVKSSWVRICVNFLFLTRVQKLDTRFYTSVRIGWRGRMQTRTRTPGHEFCYCLWWWTDHAGEGGSGDNGRWCWSMG
ncbi:leucine-rich repeat extensin-like protein 3 [Iris pallida]|uniref:Leucine-rich repeat extensin-like protein 3 n=1 Tax=Iris pallida TaxID=29817 RepID=A0AAX6DWA5_IRIPA|nr:leucine-rich repeat extensin-like protein 3 [Iris pallida]KAJ6815361.1 leucine-rich repeat extensin-like protein 3 [Iris pallida]